MSIKSIGVQISPGELIDKITILHIKRNRVTDKSKLVLVNKEYDYLCFVWNSVFSKFVESNVESAELWVLDKVDELTAVNSELWDIEDALRQKELHKEFDSHFIELARSVYITNDKRSKIKNELNAALGSDFLEVKDHVKYQ